MGLNCTGSNCSSLNPRRSGLLCRPGVSELLLPLIQNLEGFVEGGGWVSACLLSVCVCLSSRCVLNAVRPWLFLITLSLPSHFTVEDAESRPLT